MKTTNDRVFSGVFLCALLMGYSGLGQAVEQPNIVLILTDDHRFDAMSCMGHPFLETPHLDALAAEGALFEKAYVTTSLCSPSRASILTGQYAHNHRVVDNYHPVSESLTFFPEHLQASGYQTAFIGKWHMGDTDEKQRGFDHWVSFKGQGIYWPHDDGLKVKGRYVPQAYRTGFNVNGRQVEQEGYITDELTDYATDWLDQRTRDRDERPFFMYVSHKAAHADFLPPNRHAFKYENEPVPEVSDSVRHPDEYTDEPMWVKNQRNSRHGVEFAYYTDLDFAGYYRRYCETLLAVDDSVGALVKSLEKNGYSDNTVILYLGDNGFLFGEHGLIDKRCSFEESIRIPMIMKAPGRVRAGTRIREIVANIDVAPTILDLAGLERPEVMDGMSFAPLLGGPESAGETKWREYLLYEYYWERNYPQTPTMHGILNGTLKYTRFHGIWDVDTLYDLSSDPGEKVNLINHPDWQDQVQELNERLFRMLAESQGMEIPLLEDRGTKFLHRNDAGSRNAGFPDWFYREAGTTGR